VLGSIATFIFRDAMLATAPAGVPHEGLDTLGGAVAVAPSLPPATATQLLDASRAAFLDSFGVTAAICGFALLAASLAAWFLLPKRLG
jgi:DHA2 family multidrug resistance protein-like MFS transporter